MKIDLLLNSFGKSFCTYTVLSNTHKLHRHWLGMVACLCHFVISFFRLFAWRYGAAPRRNNAKRKDEITKKRQAK